MGRISLAIIVFFLLNVLSVSPLYADRGTVYSQYLVKQGEIYYEQGDLAAASHEFTKALMLDPNNRQAQYYLNQIGISDGLYVQPRLTATHAANLIESVDRYQDKIEDLKKISTYQERLNRYLENDLAAKKNQIQQLDQQLVQTNKILNTAQVEVASLKKETTALKTDKENLRQVVFAKEQSVNNLKSRMAEVQQNAHSRAAMAEQLAYAKEKEARRATDELSYSRDMLEKAHDDLRRERIESDYKTNKLLMTGVQVASSGSQLRAKDELIAELMKSVGRLEMEVASLRSRFNLPRSKSSKLSQAQPAVHNEQVGLLKKQDKIIGDLKEKLASSRRQVNVAGKDDKIDAAALNVLREQLKDVRIEVRVKEALLQQIQEQYEQTQQQLASTEQNLTLAENKLEQKDQRIRYLEKQLSQAAGKLGDVSFHYLK